jgi:hypothetical protein
MNAIYLLLLKQQGDYWTNARHHHTVPKIHVPSNAAAMSRTRGVRPHFHAFAHTAS